MPLISIITITYNAQKFLERTISSIQNQSQKDFEYILVDGNSEDGTMDIVKKNLELFDLVISEKDRGIYDAMNKGLRLAKGKYIWFMNAGDIIKENDAIEKIQKIARTNPDVIYSDTLMLDKEYKPVGLRTQVTPHKFPKIMSWKGFKYGMLICHQSFIAKREITDFYDIDNLSADIDWEIECLKKAKSIVKYDGILSSYLEGGVSQKQHRKSLVDRYKVLQKHFGFVPNFFNHIYIFTRKLFS
ncbi:MAG: glycosyltransferase family 2 protein [Leadbetterella sp.]